MLSTRIKVPIPEHGVITRHAGRRHYVYKVTRTFRNAKGQPTNTRVSIGRIDEETGLLIPNNTYWDYYPETQVEYLPTENSIRSIGTSFLTKQVQEQLGVDQILNNVLGLKRANQVGAIVDYMVSRGNVMDHIESWCQDHTWAQTLVTGQQASNLFTTVTCEEKMGFFRAWVKTQPADSCFAYDVTSFSTYAKGIEDTEWGYNRDGEKLPQINLGCYVNQNNQLPVFYVTYPGSITDVAHLESMMAYNQDLGVKDTRFVLDRGFCSTKNIQHMHANHLDVIIGTHLRHKAMREAVNQVREGITSIGYLVSPGVYARKTVGQFYGVPCTVHVYYDPVRAELQRRDLFRLVETAEEKLSKTLVLTGTEAKHYRAWFTIDRKADGTFTFGRDYTKIDQAALNNGFFTVLTTTSLDSAEVLEVYRRKDIIEKAFDEVKNHVDMRRLRTHTTLTTDGKLFCGFIALIVACRIQVVLGSMMREKAWSKQTVINELDKIRVVTTTDGTRLMNPVTKTQRAILGAFGLTAEDLTKHVTTTEPNQPYMPKTQGI